MKFALFDPQIRGGIAPLWNVGELCSHLARAPRDVESHDGHSNEDPLADRLVRETHLQTRRGAK